MQVAALLAVRRRLDEPWVRAAVVVGAAVASGVGYLWMRMATAQMFPRVRSFEGYCQRVKPPDVYPCHVASGPMIRAYLLASLLVWLGIAGACVVLVLAGRGPLAFAPLAVLAIGHAAAGWLFHDQLSVVPLLGVYAEPFFSGGLGAGYWATHGLWASIADLAVLAMPAAAVAWVVGPEREATRWRGRPALAWSSAVCVGGAIALLWFADGQVTWGSLGFSSSVPIWAPGAVMIAFGLLLPARANWWPWAIGPVALLLSAGPSSWLVSDAAGLPTTLWFGSTLWLAAAGLVASAAVPLAAVWERWRLPSDAREPAVPHAAEPRRIRPFVVLNAIAAGLVVVSMLAAHGDPLPAQISAPFPTYAGLRERAQDARAVHNLLDAVEAFDVHRATFGPAVPFDAAAGRARDDRMRWHDGAALDEKLVVSVLASSTSLVRLATLSPSGTAFCAEASREGGWRATYGSSAGARAASTPKAAMHAAIARCGDARLTRDSIPQLPVASLCDGVDQDGIIVCRSVQDLVRRILASQRGIG